MKRSHFLRTSALGTLAVCTGCLAACTKEDPAPPAGPPAGQEDVIIDLDQPSNQPLTTVGGWMVFGEVIVAHISQDVFTALQVSCTHAGTNINYSAQEQRFVCPNHGSRFDAEGRVLTGPATRNLTKYTITRQGNVLTVNT